MTTQIRDFTDDLTRSNASDEKGRWDCFWLARFPDCQLIHADQHWGLQELGVDAVLRRPNGKELLVEHKARTAVFHDCFIELWSVFYGVGDPRNRPGWSVDPDKETMWLAYASRPMGKCWLLPFQEYRVFSRAVAACVPKYRLRISRSQRGSDVWSTIHTSVPWEELYAALDLTAAEVCFEW